MEKKLIARWESQRCKDWVELWHDQYGYSYQGNNCGGSFGDAPLKLVMKFMEQNTAEGMQVFCSQKSPMRKVV